MRRQRALRRVERESLIDTAAGLSAKQSARKRSRSASGVYNALRSARTVLGARTTAELVVSALISTDITMEQIQEAREQK